MRRSKRSISGLIAIAALGTGALGLVRPIFAQPDPNNAPKADNPPARTGRGRNKQGGAKKNKKGPEKELARVEQLAGKPLTDEQKTQLTQAIQERDDAIKAARSAYQDKLAQITGLTPDEIKAKMRAMRGAGKKDKAPVAPAAPPAAAQPAPAG